MQKSSHETCHEMELKHVMVLLSDHMSPVTVFSELSAADVLMLLVKK